MYQADLADTTSLASLVGKIEQKHGGIDILINNAAIRPNTKISKITLEEWDLVFNTNLKAPFFLSQAVLPGMAVFLFAIAPAALRARARISRSHESCSRAAYSAQP